MNQNFPGISIDTLTVAEKESESSKGEGEESPAQVSRTDLGTRRWGSPRMSITGEEKSYMIRTGCRSPQRLHIYWQKQGFF